MPSEHTASGVVPEFFMESVHNPDRSAKEGRAVFDDVEHVRVTILGDRNSSGASFVVTDKYRKRWPDHYAAFQRGEVLAKSGTPLEQWPMMTKSRVLELKAVDIDNVEALAAVTDTNLGIIGLGGRELREQAKAFLDAARAVPMSPKWRPKSRGSKRRSSACKGNETTMTRASRAQPERARK